MVGDGRFRPEFTHLTPVAEQYIVNALTSSASQHQREAQLAALQLSLTSPGMHFTAHAPTPSHARSHPTLHVPPSSSPLPPGFLTPSVTRDSTPILLPRSLSPSRLSATDIRTPRGDLLSVSRTPRDHVTGNAINT